MAVSHSAGSRSDGFNPETSIFFFACTSSDAGCLVCNVDLGINASAGLRYVSFNTSSCEPMALYTLI